ncbi:hypothetical protein [Microbacterium sp. CPCC 204701]|uniref:hypothetical protein n=1 Tax=Microbacterium sp. CPCC 204701 TaxID=2493084 RepID=UPI000FDC18AE|nr:hypothetical protein [Microbacterium sp. CPCC 204701]
MHETIDAVVEIFSWVGLGAGALLAAAALVMRLLDGTWLPARAVVETEPHGRVVRWFDDDGGVNEAVLTHEQEHAIGDKQMADIFYRRGRRNRMRLTRRSPGVRAVALLAVGLLALGVLAMILSLILIFVRG